MGIGVDLAVQTLADQGLSPSEIQKRIDELTNTPEQVQDAESISKHLRERREARERTKLTELEKKDKAFELIQAGIRSGTLTFGSTPSYYVGRAKEYVELIYDN